MIILNSKIYRDTSKSCKYFKILELTFDGYFPEFDIYVHNRREFTRAYLSNKGKGLRTNNTELLRILYIQINNMKNRIHTITKSREVPELCY